MKEKKKMTFKKALELAVSELEVTIMSGACSDEELKMYEEAVSVIEKKLTNL